MHSINPSSKFTLGGKKYVVLGVVILLTLSGILYYTETHHITSFFLKKTPSDSMTPQQKEEATKNDPTTSSSTAKENTLPAPGVNHNETTDQVPVSTISAVAITSLDQTGGNVNISTTISNPASSGVCTITFTKDGAKPVVRTVNTSTNTCSASIPELEFTMIGQWRVKVIYFANNTQTSATGSITVK